MFRASPVTLRSPYEPFILEWKTLQQVAVETAQNDQRLGEDLKLLLDVISGGSSGDWKLDRYFKSRDACLDQNIVLFDDLWTIFPPGTVVYGTPYQGEEQLFLVQDNWATWPKRAQSAQLSLPLKLCC